MLWVVSQRQSKWESALPKETQDLLAAGRDGGSNVLERAKNSIEGFFNEKLGTSTQEAMGSGVSGHGAGGEGWLEWLGCGQQSSGQFRESLGLGCA